MLCEICSRGRCMCHTIRTQLYGCHARAVARTPEVECEGVAFLCAYLARYNQSLSAVIEMRFLAAFVAVTPYLLFGVEGDSPTAKAFIRYKIVPDIIVTPPVYQIYARFPSGSQVRLGNSLSGIRKVCTFRALNGLLGNTHPHSLSFFHFRFRIRCKCWIAATPVARTGQGTLPLPKFLVREKSAFIPNTFDNGT